MSTKLRLQTAATFPPVPGALNVRDMLAGQRDAPIECLRWKFCTATMPTKTHICWCIFLRCKTVIFAASRVLSSIAGEAVLHENDSPIYDGRGCAHGFY